jgi:glycerol-3-phosphate dehydrogenase (NAD(P)+)
MARQMKIGVIGAGAWGTALGIVANRAGSKVTLWTRNANVLSTIRDKRMNEPYLPGIFIDPAIAVTDVMEEICRNDVLILSIPSQFMRSIAIGISDHLEATVPLVIATKGIERGSLALMSEVVSSIMPHNPLAVLSGPNFADEAAKGVPTATTIALKSEALGSELLHAIGGKHFRPYLTDDLIGTQIGGAVKNVIAIACGIAIGKGLGENTKAAIITRGMAEIARLCEAKGGAPRTLMGLAGFGDLVLTCNSPKSRNMSLGIAIGQGQKFDSISGISGIGLTEGVATAESVTELAQRLGVAMPLCAGVHAVLRGRTSIDTLMDELLERPFKHEFFLTNWSNASGY